MVSAFFCSAQVHSGNTALSHEQILHAVVACSLIQYGTPCESKQNNGKKMTVWNCTLLPNTGLLKVCVCGSFYDINLLRGHTFKTSTRNNQLCNGTLWWYYLTSIVIVRFLSDSLKQLFSQFLVVILTNGTYN